MLVSSGALSEYFEWESLSAVKIVEVFEQDGTQSFLPSLAVRSYFTTCDNRQRKNLDKILSEIFNTNFPLIDSELVLQNHTAVFCILLSIGRGGYINHFVSFEDLADRRLPFDLTRPPQHFPRIEGDPSFLSDFCDSQMRYCVPVFDSRMLHKRFGSRRLLPITYKERLMTEGIATMHLIRLYEPYNKMIPSEDTSNPHNSNTFLLKSFPAPQGLAAYAEVVKSFCSVGNTEGIIRLYGSYDHCESSHILLEYADKGTLNDFFRTETPPSRGDDIVEFWENILRLIKALKAIHSVKVGHHNVCPEKILVLSNGKKTPSAWRFKFSDVGSSPSCAPNSERGARSYAPPEYMSHQPNGGLSANADIWSLGCILSEAALWVADGYKGILDYRKQRDQDAATKESGSFHDGEQVLQLVLEMHTEIEGHLRRSDHVTKDVLTSIIDEMLIPAHHRPDASKLLQRSEYVISKARKTLAVVSNRVYTCSGGRNRSRPQYTIQPVSTPLPLPLPQPQTPFNQTKQKPESKPANFVDQPSVENRKTPIKSNASSMPNVAEAVSPILAHNHCNGSGTERAATPESKVDISATSWFIESPSMESPNTPLTSPHTSIHKSQPQLPSIIQQYETNQPCNVNRISRSNHSMELNQPINIHRLSDVHPQTLRTQLALEKDVRLPGALQTLPSQGYPFEYRVAPPLPRNSFSKNKHTHSISVRTPSPEFNSNIPVTPLSMNGDETQGSRLSSLTSFPPITWNSLQPRPNTGGEINRENNPVKSRNEFRSRLRYPSNSSTSSVPFEKKPALNEHVRNDSMNSCTSSIIASKSNQTCFRSAVSMLKKHHISSALSSRCNSMLSLIPNTSDVDNPASALSPLRELPTYRQSRDSVAFLDIDTCRLWKQLNKTKKKSQVPLLPGAHLLQPLHNRDHVFIVDDSASMAPYWPDVCRVFDGLSYVVKGMSPAGTDLLFTISYDKRRRKSTHVLCTFLAEKRLQSAQTNIALRLDLQLIAYRLKLSSSKKGARDLRPVNFYLLTNGEWDPESEGLLMSTICQTATLLQQLGLKDQLFISFVGLTAGDDAAERIEALGRLNWGGVLRIKWTVWNENVWEMLRGDLYDYHVSHQIDVGDIAIDIKTDASGNVVNQFLDGKLATSQTTDIPSEIPGLFELP